MQKKNTEDTIIPASSAILVGGGSRRFGSDKAFMKFSAQTVSSQTYNRLRKLFAEVFFVSNEEKNILENQILHVDLYPDKGPLGGLYTALKKCSHSWRFVTACDTPFISREIISLLWKQRTADAVVPVWNNKQEPLNAFYNIRCSNLIEDLLDSGNLSLKNFLEQIDSEKINLLDYYAEADLETLFLNINTPENFNKAKKIWSDLQ